MISRTGCGKKIKVIAFTCLLIAVPLFNSQAALHVKDYKFPSKNVLIKEAFDASSTENADPRIVFCIQDAHCNYEAQKNTAEVLDYLARNYGLRLIMVEGGYGYVGLSSLRGYAPLKTRQEVAERYLREGRISGEEYFDIVSDSDIELYGIDDEGLYDAHLDVFWKIDAVRGEGIKHLDRAISSLNKLKPFLYSDELRQLEQKKEAYESKGMQLADYCAYLAAYASKKAVVLDNYPAFTAFTRTIAIEKNMDLKSSEAERNVFIKALAAGLDNERVGALIAKTQSFKDGKLPSKEYYSYLKSAAQPAIDLKKDYPNLAKYIDYVCGSEAVSPVKLIKDISSLEEVLKSESFTDDSQRKLDEIYGMARVLRHFFELELTPEEYAYFKANKAKFSVASWQGFIGEKCAKYNIPEPAVSADAVDENIGILEEFYKLGAAREKVFVKNLQKKMDGSREEAAVLITGGFHTPGMTRALKTGGYSYVVLAPVITSKSDSSLYFSVLREQTIDVNDDYEEDIADE